MMASALNIQLPRFEGPLALLLYLIRKEEMDIVDIEINKITAQYLEYIKLMKELDLEVAGEFIAMAATLIHIKSRILLPQYDEKGEVVENADPRKELVQRLLEYQKYQEASKLLYERPLLGRDIWVRGIREKLEVKEDEVILEENALFALIASFRKAINTAKKKVHKVAIKAQSIASRIMEMKPFLKIGEKVPLSSMIESLDNRRRQLLITFLSSLELAKIGFIRLYQSDVYQEIYLEARKEVEGDALARVEEYDTMNVEDAAQAIMDKSKKLDEKQLAMIDAEINGELSDSDLAEEFNFDPEPQETKEAQMTIEQLQAEAALMEFEIDAELEQDAAMETASNQNELLGDRTGGNNEPEILG